jgi:hypothetical protein
MEVQYCVADGHPVNDCVRPMLIEWLEGTGWTAVFRYQSHQIAWHSIVLVGRCYLSANRVHIGDTVM